MFIDIDLILSRYPSQQQITQALHQYGIHGLQTWDDWQQADSEGSYAVWDNHPMDDNDWAAHLSLILSVVPNSQSPDFFYFSFAKSLADICRCNIRCCNFNGSIIGEFLNPNNPFLDFAYIGKHWYLIDDVNTDPIDSEPGSIQIIKSIHQQMTAFLAQ
ncbi:hypothetical protein H9Q10_05130 [Eikenella sp. S3360]|uniref:Uncharacterized protein n=1 Tax=Eikenella glucosivorans TaxID=2766967 RepID=A0ABS0N9U3_9NEIS|nr:hypothetical protein [Eikenella glucosivorans]MBH5329050.1 hypothetical protein [Eikenella glucosivorans]